MAMVDLVVDLVMIDLIVDLVMVVAKATVGFAVPFL